MAGKRARHWEWRGATIRAGEAEIAGTIVQVRNDVRRAYFELLVADARLNVTASTSRRPKAATSSADA